jgi:ABC-2 type transport system permease protein
MDFMADWLKVVVLFNPLTYAIEPIRHIYSHQNWNLTDIVLQTPWLSFNFITVMAILLLFDLLILFAIQPLLRRRFA